MFRKPKQQGTKRPIRRRTAAVEEEEEDNDNATVQAAIRHTQKKHKWLQALPMVSGGDGVPTKPQQRMDTSTSTSTTTTDASGELTVLAQKHQQAMEAFIHEQLKRTTGTTTATEPNIDETTTIITPRDEKAMLYQELAEELYKPEPKDDNGNGSNNNTNHEDRGAVLVGGTGLAEVILPIRQRLESSSLQQYDEPRRNVKNKHASSAVPKDADATATSVGKATTTSAAPLMRSMMMVRKHPTTTKQQQDAKEQQQPQQDEGRMGFDAFRGKQPNTNTSNTSSSTSTNGKKAPVKSRDNQVFSKFVSRQREQSHR